MFTGMKEPFITNPATNVSELVSYERPYMFLKLCLV
jgi:hypothetical protein